jgi:hypothetical protein
MILLFISLYLYFIAKRQFIKINRNLSVLFILCLLGLLLFLYQAISTQLHSSSVVNADSLIERLFLWRNSVKMILEHFWLGVGGGNWQIFFPKYSLNGIWRCDEMNISFQRPHNDFLWVWCEYGTIGFVLKMIVFIGVIFPAIKRLRDPQTEKEKKYEVIVFLSFYLANVIILFFDFPSERAEHTIWTTILMAYLFSCTSGYYKSLFHIKNSLEFKTLLSLILLFSFYICFEKMKGEYFTKNIYLAKVNYDYTNEIIFCDLSESFAYSLDPVSMPINWYKGNALIASKKFNQGMYSFMLAKEQNPYNRYILNDLATCYALKNNYKKAEILYCKTAQISPRYDEAILNLISVYITINNYKKARFWEAKLCHESQRRTDLKSILYSH